eukprot:3138522-Pleurochrysis_carterae.AAC.3
MATDPVTRQLAFNAMSPQVGARRPTAPDGQVALHYVHLIIFAQRLHPTNQTLDDHIWVATLEDNWGVDLWPALFTQAGDFDVPRWAIFASCVALNYCKIWKSMQGWWM